MDEVALCLRFMDLLRQDLPAVGEGMAEASCCPLRLVGTVPPTLLPFMPLGAGIPLTASERERERDTEIADYQSTFLYIIIKHCSHWCFSLFLCFFWLFT